MAPKSLKGRYVALLVQALLTVQLQPTHYYDWTT